jgi:tRNA modification GTPase
VECSSVQDGGTSALEATIKDYITQGRTSTSEEGRISTIRQKEFLEKTRSDLDRARHSCLAAASPELIAVDIRAALQELGMLAGEVYTDDILEVLFKQFCIGK